MKSKATKAKHQKQPPAEEVSALLALYNARRYAEAEYKMRSLLGFYPDFGFGWKLLGGAQQMQGKDALPALQKAAQLLPHDPQVNYNFGVVLKSAGRVDEAAASFRRAIKISPDFVEAHNALGALLKDQGQFKDALASYRRVLELSPDSYNAYNNLAFVLRQLGQFNAAVECCRSAIKLKPDLAGAYSNLSIALGEVGLNEEAIACNRKALELQPDFVDAQTNLLFLLNANLVNDASDRLEEARKFGRMVSRNVTSRYADWQCEEQPRRLRVGIVSGDLNDHPVGYALKSLLEFLDPARVELIAYPINLRIDGYTDLIKPYFAAWKPLHGLSDEAAARLIHADGVHVLLDLCGHTGKNRLSTFAWKPAPVQASWLGYFATTGVAQMDYLLTSEAAVPEAHRGQYTENVWYLPDTWMCFTPPDFGQQVTPLPALRHGYLTFGCFQRMDKFGEEVLPAWSRILAALPGARLNLACKQLGDEAMKAQFIERLQQHGIDPERVKLQGLTPTREGYLARYSEVDVMLDSFPYPGVTTTCEALWMGVPTITLAGDTLLSRQGAGVITAGGLSDWVAKSVADYVGKATSLTGDLPGLAKLRAGLREQVKASLLFDAKRFARNFEDALWGMWQAHTRSNTSATEKAV
jgi:protein O-GlcNAc transferase